MNTRVSLIALICLAGCAQTPTPAPPMVTIIRPALPPNYFWLNPHADQPPAKACLLGTSCLTLDSQPFETCLVGDVGSGGKRCGDKLAEFMLVEAVPGGESGESSTK